MSSAEIAIRAIRAIECLSKLMDVCDEYDEEEPKIKKRKVYVTSEDVESQLLKAVAWTNTDSSDSFCPITMENFDAIYAKLSSNVHNTDLRVPSVSLRMRLALSLRYLIAGESHRTLEGIAHISRKSTTKIIRQMLKILIEILGKDYLKLPKSQNEWISAAKDFEQFWDFPNTLGILDAKNFRIKLSPEESTGNSLILLCIVDAHSRFQYIEVIESKENEHCTAYKNSKLYKSLITKTLNIPPEKPLKGQIKNTPYIFVTHESFGIDRYTLNAFDKNSKLTRSQKAFNYRIKRAGLPAEMAFELISYRFKIFHRLSDMDINIAKLVIKTCFLLHNFLTQKLTKPLDCNEEELGVACASVFTLSKLLNDTDEISSQTRHNICKYFVNEGNKVGK